MSAPSNILVVDDEPDIELLINQRFRRHIRAGEFLFAFARDGEQALHRLQMDTTIDLILLDINMPVMDGLTLLARMREQRLEVRAIIVSAYGDMPNIRTAMNRGAFDFVSKPLDMIDLEITMRKTLDDIARVRDIERRRAAAERAKGNLARYFSPNLVDFLAERDEPFGPVRRQNVAVLFADIVGFTAMSEKMPAELVVTLLRQFQQHMTEKIFACGGTVEKYIGDSIFAIFGLPTASDRDAGQALLCAIQMQTALDEWNRARGDAGDPPLSMGIGANYGHAVIGDVGSERGLLSFTVIGDTVNVAARLQGLTRMLDTSLLVSDTLVKAAQCHSDFGLIGKELEEKGEITLRGRREAVRVWLNPTRKLTN